MGEYELSAYDHGATEQPRASNGTSLLSNEERRCYENPASMNEQIADLAKILALTLDKLLQERNKELVGTIENLLVAQDAGRFSAAEEFVHEESGDMHADATPNAPAELVPSKVSSALSSFPGNGHDSKSLSCMHDETEVGKDATSAQGLGFIRQISATSMTSSQMAAARTSQLQKGQAAAFRRQTSRDRSDNPTCATRIRGLSESMPMQLFFSVAMVTNSAVIGAQVQYTAMHPQDGDTVVFTVLNQFYAAVFLTELVMKLIGEGKQFLWPSDWGQFWWNYIDVASVCSSLIEFALFVLTASVGNSGISKGPTLRIIRILRIVRLVRVIRLMRLVRLISSLRRLIQSILATMTALGWSFVLLSMIIYMFGIIFTDIVSTVSQDPEQTQSETAKRILETDFKDLHTSMITLFLMISNGVDWGNQFHAFFEIHWLLAYTLIVYVAFCLFAVLNVMTGTFCQFAIDSANRDQDVLLQNMRAMRDHQVQMIRAFFDTIRDPDNDAGGHSHVTLYDFERRFEAPEVLSFFQVLDIDVNDAWTLFTLMSPGNDGTLNADEFIEGCMRLKGAAKKIDVAVMMREQRRMKKKLDSISQIINDLGALQQLQQPEHMQA